MMEPAKDRMRNNVSDPLDRAYAGRVVLERNMGSHLAAEHSADAAIPGFRLPAAAAT